MKSQLSTELIVLLAIILIIIVVSISSLSNFGAVTQQFKAKQDQQFWTTADIGISAASFDSTHGRLNLLNNLAYPIIVTNISINGNLQNVSVFIAPSQSQLVNVTYEQNLSVGDPFELVLGFEYTNVVDGSIGFIESDVPLRGTIAVLN